MTSRYSASIGVAAGDRAGAVLAAVEADARFYPAGDGTATRASAKNVAGGGAGGTQAGVVLVDIDAGQLPHLRAGINTALRLVQVAYESIGAASASAAAAAAPAPDAAAPAPPAGRRRRADHHHHHSRRGSR